jgi:hypothetical protein
MVPSRSASPSGIAKTTSVQRSPGLHVKRCSVEGGAFHGQARRTTSASAVVLQRKVPSAAMRPAGSKTPSPARRSIAPSPAGLPSGRTTRPRTTQPRARVRSIDATSPGTTSTWASTLGSTPAKPSWETSSGQ